MDDGFTEAAAAPPVFKRSFCGGNILTIGGIVLAVAIAFATGFASGNASNQAELVQLKAAASTSALYTSKSSKGPTAKSSKAHLGCDMMVGVHLGDSWHGISCDINAVTACPWNSPPGACCYAVEMDLGNQVVVDLAALHQWTDQQNAVLSVQGQGRNAETIAGVVNFWVPDIGKGLVQYNVAKTDNMNIFVDYMAGIFDLVVKV